MRHIAFTALIAASVFTPLAAAAENLTFTLENHTPNMIVQFYATPQGGGKRLELLNKKGLWGGKSRKLTIARGADACVYSTRAVFEDNSFESVSRKIDFCETDVYSIED
ncbi:MULTISPECIES: hypothetical protein [Alphaproteobacteria]|uniref:Uncharacterized protein n=2 Tax=Alphaproteobacteria TaxID=28211 RepID=A0A512HHD0_9HYPH|nr:MULTISPECIES: hypothetical protein [Alphaproteobacteria]GEO84865.1 hypothetical protein RNA01_17970 [Ciceribacter naphthalenivorans]GLR22799.1 hypothetical protein GCM10007920_25870 [Ciceribacter naphthalenivorans]GLT05655.1 hypothetical protein GCM10007926_25870 [Sphingomonas psychrolutea]